jgi:hypothetical protein
MLFRRIAQHVKEQNWTAVGIDFVIVIVGVFLGIQVSNWNEARVQAQNTATLIERLEDEFTSLEENLSTVVGQLETITSGTGCLIEEIRSESPTKSHDELSSCIWSASALLVLPDIPAVVTEMVSSGSLTQIANDDLRKEIIFYRDNHLRYQRYMPQALASMYPPNSKFFEAVDWNTDTSTWSYLTASDAVIDSDIEALRAAEGELQIKQLVQYDVADFGKAQLARVRVVLALIEASK